MGPAPGGQPPVRGQWRGAALKKPTPKTPPDKWDAEDPVLLKAAIKLANRFGRGAKTLMGLVNKKLKEANHG